MTDYPKLDSAGVRGARQVGREMLEFFPSERVLPDDYPVYGDYFYLADGKVYRSDYHDVTVGWLKKKEKFAEVRNCDWRRFNGTNRQIRDLAAGTPGGGTGG